MSNEWGGSWRGGRGRGRRMGGKCANSELRDGTICVLSFHCFMRKQCHDSIVGDWKVIAFYSSSQKSAFLMFSSLGRNLGLLMPARFCCS